MARTRPALRRSCAAALLLMAAVQAVHAGADARPGLLQVAASSGEILLQRPLADGARWCVAWNHSVAGFPVHDCYLWRDGRMRLERSHQPDFAAGLGHIAGRGVQRSDGRGGYWIEEIDEAVAHNAYRLRVGAAAVAHRLLIGGEEIDLSAMAGGRAVWLRIVTPHLDEKPDHVHRIRPESPGLR